MLTEIRRILSQTSNEEIAEAILGVAVLFAVLFVFLIVTP